MWQAAKALCPNSITSENRMVQRQVQFYNVTPIILAEMVLSIILLQDNRIAKVHPYIAMHTFTEQM